MATQGGFSGGGYSSRRIAGLGFFVGAVLLLCAGLLFWRLTAEVKGYRAELDGARQLRVLNRLAFALQDHRDHTVLGEQAGRAETEARVGVAWNDLLASMPADQRASGYVERAGSSWAQLRKDLGVLNAPTVIERHSDLIEQLLAKIVELADSSQLTLSAQLDTFYLQDMLVNRLLPVQEQLSRLRALGTLALSERRLSPEAAQQIRSGMIELETRLKVQQAGIERLLSSMPGQALAIDDSQAQLQLGVSIVLGTLTREVLGGSYRITPQQFFNDVSEQIRIVPALIDTVFSPELERSLRTSIAKSTRLAAGIGFVVLLALLGLTVVVRAEMRNATALGRANRQNRELIDNAPMPLVVVDAAGRISQVNAAAGVLFGYSDGELLGNGIEVLVPEGRRDAHRQQRVRFEGGGQQRVMAPGRELTARRKDGSEFPCEIALAGIRNDDGLATIAAISDLTSIRLAEEQLRRVSDHLLQVAGERTDELLSSQAELTQTVAELAAKKRALHEAEKLLTLGRTVASFAHDIATPIGNSNMALSTVADEVATFQREIDAGTLRKSSLLAFMEVVRQGMQLSLKNIARSRELLEAMKQTALDQATGAAREIVLDAWFHDMDIVIIPLVKRTPHRLQRRIDPGLVLATFPGPLGQVVTNLVNNALIHAFDEGVSGEILLSAMRCDQGIRIAVSDNGRGMTPEIRARLFEAFFTTRAGSGGTGLGMHIVQSTVEGQLGGTLTVRTEPGQGTEIAILLPEVAPDSGASPGATEQA